MVKYHIENFDAANLNPNNIDRIQIHMIPEGSRVLEIGCATGFMSRYLIQEMHCEVVGVEVDPAQADIARNVCSDFIMGAIDDGHVQSRLDKMVADRGRFDVVFMSQVIEHIACPEPVLEKIHDWLGPQSVFIVSTCNIAHWRCRFKLLMGKWEYEDYGIFDKTHLRFFTVHSFRKLLENCRYRIVEQDVSFEDFCPFRLLFDKRLIAPSDILRCIPLMGKYLRRRYIHAFRNLISTQFVYKARSGLYDGPNAK